MDHKEEARTGPDDTAPTIPSTGEAEILTKKAENDLVQCEFNLQYGSKTREKWVNPEENDTAWPEGHLLVDALRLHKPQSIHLTDLIRSFQDEAELTAQSAVPYSQL